MTDNRTLPELIEDTLCTFPSHRQVPFLSKQEYGAMLMAVYVANEQYPVHDPLACPVDVEGGECNCPVEAP